VFYLPLPHISGSKIGKYLVGVQSSYAKGLPDFVIQAGINSGEIGGRLTCQQPVAVKGAEKMCDGGIINQNSIHTLLSRVC
jgi:hypothetical protein